MIGWIILIVAALLLVAGAAWMLTLARQPILPRGKRRCTVAVAGYKVHLVVSNNAEFVADLEVFAKACAGALWSVAMHVSRGNAAKLSEVVVLVAPAYEGGPAPTAAAYATRAHAKVGPGLPMIVVRPSVVLEVFAKGEPIIHEAIHLLSVHTDYSHAASAMWHGAGGDTSLQAKARAGFLLWRS